ncbi:glycosyl hydrolase catalytic core-domain-containing protein [Boeremia exigua]|uniref:glycosyl hydrolase catalytic core-domain-containing protein n=1 Tax=Boeremia exigua TaxID=749465 RepID=UPI001E8E2FB9|nr:glycosyl hydrolase catalytic core-domain-containing protein [Boeremia exigua]KAH6644139.1 glycosyl hydrolase catalytic core-domain-containing protein [Boeremia exigua]
MTKLSLLALIGAAAAHPSYGGHSKFHSKPAAGTGKPYPTGGWSGNYNSTQVPAGTASYEEGKTSTIDITTTSTRTITSTIYGTPAQSAVVENVSSKPAGEQCGPATVTVTATDKYTVTVTPGVSSAYSTGVVTSSIALPSSKAGEYEASSYIVVSSTPAAEKPSSSKPAVATSSKVEEYEAPTPSASVPAITSVAESAYSTAVPSSTAAASSSAAPKPSGAPTYTGTKRGLAYNDGELCASFGSNFGFAYNWAQTESKDVGAPFIPMMHKLSDSTAEAWLANVEKAVKAGSKAVMGFNEPDHVDQANMSPEVACSAWKEYMNPIAASYPDVTILGPSVTNGGAPMGLDWLTRFHDGCPDAIVHATNIHFYDIYEEATFDRFKAQVEKAAADYGKPVWITEFGLNPGSASEEQAATFLKKAMDFCDSSSVVEGYSWFMVGTGENQLNTASGLSTLGQVYAGSS